MHGGEGIYRLDLSAEISREEIQPELKLKSSVQVTDIAFALKYQVKCLTLEARRLIFICYNSRLLVVKSRKLRSAIKFIWPKKFFSRF